MCINNSVGQFGVNNRNDVVVVQVLINMNIGQLMPLRPLAVDGICGPLTITGIQEFQRRVVGAVRPDGLVEPNGPTLQTLRNGIPAGFTEEKLQGIMPSALLSGIRRFLQPMITVMANRGISTPRRQAHFLAQVGHESGGLRFTEEIGSGQQYEGRVDLGNTEPGDGPRFKGRGLIQLTGRSNYRAYGQAIGMDLLSDGRWQLVATDTNLAADVAGWYWQTRNINSAADADNLEQVTRLINGGLLGLEDRRAYLQRAKCFLV